MPDYQLLTELLGLPQVRVTHYELLGRDRIRLAVESTLEAAVCPDCQRVSFALHEMSKAQLIRDLPIWQRRCWLHYAPRRFKCAICQDTFVEQVLWRAPDLDYTRRYEQAIYQRARREPIAHIAESEQLSEDIVQGIFERGAKKTLDARGYPLVKVLGLDEIALHKGHGHFNLIITAPEQGIVLDVLSDRKKDTLEAWFDERGTAWCATVEVCSADMWDAYHEAALAKLPNVRLTVDRFHVMKNLNAAVTQARRCIQKCADAPTQELLKGCRWLLVKNAENLTDEERPNLAAMLVASPELKTCYELKEAFRTWFNTRSDRVTAERTLNEWLIQVQASGLKALHRFTKTIGNWRERILNYFDGRHSNGFAEGANLKIKLLNRRAFGYHNFASFRLHVLVAFEPRSR